MYKKYLIRIKYSHTNYVMTKKKVAVNKLKYFVFFSTRTLADIRINPVASRFGENYNCLSGAEL